MAIRTIRLCDVDNSHEASGEVTVALDGDAVHLDVCDQCGKKVRDGVSRLMKPGTPIALRDVLKHAANGGSFDPTVVRSWAQARNMQVADKGRVPEDVITAWRAAGSPTSW